MPIGQHHAMGPLDAGHRQACAVWAVLAGSVTDQAALHGLLAKVGDLSLPLLSVRRVDPEQDSPAEPPHDVDAGEGGRTRMYATITKLQIKAEEQAVEAVEGLSVLLDEAGGLPGLLQGRVVRSGPRELVMVTVYESEAAAEAAGARMRPRLGETIGPVVTDAPDRWGGPVVAAWP